MLPANFLYFHKKFIISNKLESFLCYANVYRMPMLGERSYPTVKAQCRAMFFPGIPAFIYQQHPQQQYFVTRDQGQPPASPKHLASCKQSLNLAQSQQVLSNLLSHASHSKLVASPLPPAIIISSHLDAQLLLPMSSKIFSARSQLSLSFFQLTANNSYLFTSPFLRSASQAQLTVSELLTTVSIIAHTQLISSHLLSTFP